MTKIDLRAIENILDTKLKDISLDISAIQARTAEIESHQSSTFDVLQMKVKLIDIEKRLTAIQGKLMKLSSK
ncbi:hypothetical protein HYW87_05000 [Candidatus Roizmanbacteria bacterium]|nr:hypothetical protein [Candidatus Roizmanbacteria bacterium]